MNIKALPREKLFQSIAYYIGFITLGLAMVSTGPALPKLLEHTHSSIDTFAVVFTISSIGFLLGSYAGGWLFDQVNGNIVIGICHLLVALTLAATPLISSLWWMGLVMFIAVFSMSLIDLGSNTLMTWIYSEGNEGAAFMNALHFFFGVGAAISPLLIGKIVTSTGDIYWAYWLLAILMIPSIVLMFIVPSPVIRHQEEKQTTTRKNGKGLLVILLVIYFMFYVGLEAQFGNYIVSYIEAMPFGVESATSYQINSMFWGMITVGRFLVIPIATKLKPRTIITIDTFGIILSFIIMLSFNNSIVSLWIGTILLGLSLASMFPTGIIFAEKQLGLTGKITSYFYLGIGVSGMVFPWIIGQFFEKKGASSFLIVISIVAVLLVFNWAVINISSRKKQIAGNYENHEIQ
ncbi:MAG: MFS transporter [Anaerolineaceae bacterium]|nr:MFS transporter [Anaerolineaceae bacterium]